jgi:hypothetical protein
VSWKGKVSIIAGCTTAIYGNMAMHSAMGERFVMYTLDIPGRIEVLTRMDANANDMKEKRQEMKDAFKQYLDVELAGKLPEKLPEPAPLIISDLKQLANFTTLARTPIERDLHTPSKEIIFKHDYEGPTRFYSQITALAGAMMVINEGELEDVDKRILFKISLDSIPKMKHIVLRELARYTAVETNGLAIKINYPNPVTSRILEDLNALELVDRRKGAGNRNLWTLKDEWRSMIQHYEGITDSGTELVGNSEGESVEQKQYAISEKELDAAEVVNEMFGDRT